MNMKAFSTDPRTMVVPFVVERPGAASLINSERHTERMGTAHSNPRDRRDLLSADNLHYVK